MKIAFLISPLLLLALFNSACISHYDGKIREREISLRIVSDLNEFQVYLKDKDEERLIKPKYGIYHFITPELRFHKPVILGIELNDNVWDIPDFLIIKIDSDTVKILSCEEIWDLDKDTNGYSVLKIKAP